MMYNVSIFEIKFKHVMYNLVTSVNLTIVNSINFTYLSMNSGHIHSSMLFVNHK